MEVQDSEALSEVSSLLAQYQSEVVTKANSAHSGYTGRHYYSYIKPSDYPTGTFILKNSLQIQAEALHEITAISDDSRLAFLTLEEQLLKRNLPLTLKMVEGLVERAISSTWWEGNRLAATKKVQQLVEREGAVPPSLEPKLRTLRQVAAATIQDAMNQYIAADNRKIIMQIDELLGENTQVKPDAGEAWTDKALADLEIMTTEARSAWDILLTQAMTAEAAKPNAKWLAEAARHEEAIGEWELARHLTSWLTLVASPPGFGGIRPSGNGIIARIGLPEYEIYRDALDAYNNALREYRASISQRNLMLLKGLTWYVSLCSAPELARAVGRMTQVAFTNVDGYGVWATKAGNAGIWALGQMPGGVGVAPLARLRTKLRDRGALKLIAAAIESAAKASGMTVEELEDLAVPTGGLDTDGTRREMFGTEGAVTLTLDARTGRTKLEWFGADGKPRKAVPAGVKREFSAEVKALKAAEEEITSALSAQAARFDRALLDERVLPMVVWRERYAAHPVLGNLARRLIWTVGDTPALPTDDVFQNASGDTIVKLWHPIHAAPEIVLRWRDALEARGIVQPFKQAHREVYLLTDAERATRTYSNRFAAHVLKQHQFNSLCVLRGWKNTLRLMVDDSYPPASRALPQHRLRAEFWIEGIGDDYGTDTNDAGTYLRVATDQVRFYRENAETNYAHAGGGGYAADRRNAPAEPLPLDQVPPLVLSEVMRDVDLFVGVASIGNDPAWADGGPEGRYHAYWQNYAFGDLGETAKTRAEVLARLLPRLKIASRCRLDGKFLVVRGDVRTYKVHLGSGNILMEPNDQYLCIVPGRSEDSGELFLPFEGDRMLAIILSKAFLLADDAQIKDRSIVSQIKR